MNLKNIFVIFLISALFFWYTLVYSSFYKNIEINFSGVSGKNIYLDSQKLSGVIVAFQSKDMISNYTIHSNCKTTTEFLYTL